SASRSGWSTGRKRGRRLRQSSKVRQTRDQAFSHGCIAVGRGRTSAGLSGTWHRAWAPEAGWRNFVVTQTHKDGRPSCGAQATFEVCRGAARLLRAHGLAVVSELSLANARRADLAGVTAAGEIWIVEIKSCLADLRADQKWPEYRDFCDRFLFAV